MHNELYFFANNRQFLRDSTACYGFLCFSAKTSVRLSESIVASFETVTNCIISKKTWLPQLLPRYSGGSEYTNIS